MKNREFAAMSATNPNILAHVLEDPRKPANWKSSKPREKPRRSTTAANEANSTPGPFNKEQMGLLLKLLKSNPESGIPSSSLAQTRPDYEDDDWRC